MVIMSFVLNSGQSQPPTPNSTATHMRMNARMHNLNPPPRIVRTSLWQACQLYSATPVEKETHSFRHVRLGGQHTHLNEGKNHN